MFQVLVVGARANRRRGADRESFTIESTFGVTLTLTRHDIRWNPLQEPAETSPRWTDLAATDDVVRGKIGARTFRPQAGRGTDRPASRTRGSTSSS